MAIIDISMLFEANITNPSPLHRFKSWTTFVIPDKFNLQETDQIECSEHGWIAHVGAKTGLNDRYIHVNVLDMDPAEEVIASVWKKEEGDVETVGIVDNTFLPVPGEIKELSERTPNRDPIPLMKFTVNGKEILWRPDIWEIKEHSFTRTVYEAFGRVPGTMFVGRWWFYIYPNSRTVPVAFHMANSDPTKTDYMQDLDGLELITLDTIVPTIDSGRRLGFGDPFTNKDDETIRLTLINDPVHQEEVQFADGQGFGFVGRLLIFDEHTDGLEFLELEAARHAPVVSELLPKYWKGSWGPWGEIPTLHSKEDTPARGHGFEAMLNLYKRFIGRAGRKGKFWDIPEYGSNRKPSDTGDQQDFGVTKLAPALAPEKGNPFHLLELIPSVLFEAIRPGTYLYEENGSPFDPDKHPRFKSWGLVNHYNWNNLGDRDWETIQRE